jgi:nanoRNase/pAp phosphatase (c-di-AMP/oligoRNAs hydrolase)
MALDTVQQLKKLIEKSNDILITFKKEYTIDSVASALILADYISSLDKQYHIVCDGFASEKHTSFFPESEDIKRSLDSSQQFVITLNAGKGKIKEFRYAVEEDKLHIYITPKKGYFSQKDVQAHDAVYGYDLIMVLDTPDLISLGQVYSHHTEFFENTPIINIDHTTQNEHYGQLNVIDTNAVSVTEQLYDLLKQDNVSFDKKHYTTLLSGIIHKTRSFKNTEVTPRSLHIASELIKNGADNEHVIKHLYQKKSVETIKLWGLLLSRLSQYQGDSIIYSYVEKKDLQTHTIGADDILEIVDEMLVHIPEANFIVLAYERDAGEYHHVVWSKSVKQSESVTKTFNPQRVKDLVCFKLKGNDIKQSQNGVLKYMYKRIHENKNQSTKDTGQ